jgi:prevent-host-death family protein
MDQHLSVSEARATLPAVLDAVERGEEITVTRHGKPVAVLVRPDRLRRRRAEEAFASAREVHEMLERAREQPLPRTPRPGITEERAEELIAQIRADRSAR